MNKPIPAIQKTIEEKFKGLREDMQWSDESTEYEKTLVLGNLNLVEAIMKDFLASELLNEQERIERRILSYIENEAELDLEQQINMEDEIKELFSELKEGGE